MLPRRRRQLEALRARLYGQLDQKIGREKHILRRYIQALSRSLREQSREKAKGQPHA